MVPDTLAARRRTAVQPRFVTVVHLVRSALQVGRDGVIAARATALAASCRRTIPFVLWSGCRRAIASERLGWPDVLARDYPLATKAIACFPTTRTRATATTARAATATLARQELADALGAVGMSRPSP